MSIRVVDGARPLKKLVFLRWNNIRVACFPPKKAIYLLFRISLHNPLHPLLHYAPPPFRPLVLSSAPSLPPPPPRPPQQAQCKQMKSRDKKQEQHKTRTTMPGFLYSFLCRCRQAIQQPALSGTLPGSHKTGFTRRIHPHPRNSRFVCLPARTYVARGASEFSRILPALHAPSA